MRSGFPSRDVEHRNRWVNRGNCCGETQEVRYQFSCSTTQIHCVTSTDKVRRKDPVEIELLGVRVNFVDVRVEAVDQLPVVNTEHCALGRRDSFETDFTRPCAH